MKLYRYSNQKTGSIYEIVRHHRDHGIYFGNFIDGQGDATPLHGPRGNYSNGSVERLRKRGSRPVYELMIGTFVVNPWKVGLGSVMLFHMLKATRRVAVVHEIHICDGGGGHLFWEHLFNREIRIRNLEGDEDGLNSYRAYAPSMTKKLEDMCRQKGWLIDAPEIMTIAVDHVLSRPVH